jgi:stringent starvation protein B
MKQLKSYLFQAVYNWVLDNNYTPHILVDTSSELVTVPREFVQEDRIVLNIHPQSVDGFIANDDGLSFFARFAGRSRPVSIPPEAVLAIYARETNQGMVFQADGIAGEMLSEILPQMPQPPKPQRPQLHIVK